MIFSSGLIHTRCSGEDLICDGSLVFSVPPEKQVNHMQLEQQRAAGGNRLPVMFAQHLGPQPLTASQRPQSCRSAMSHHAIFVNLNVECWKRNPKQKMFWLCNKSSNKRNFIHRDCDVMKYLSLISNPWTSTERQRKWTSAVVSQFLHFQNIFFEIQEVTLLHTEETFTSAEEFHRHQRSLLRILCENMLFCPIADVYI